MGHYVWRFAPANGMVVLTSNRNMQDDNSLVTVHQVQFGWL